MEAVRPAGVTHPDERESAEMAAARFSRWQILDMVLVHRMGHMRITRNRYGRPCAPVDRMIADRILAEGASGGYVMPGPRFTAVMYALHRSGAVQSLAKA